MAQMPAWSYSSLTAYETCPKRYQLTRVLKQVTEPQTEATRWGNQVHKALELRVKDKVPLPPGMSSYEPLCAKLDVAPGQVFTEAKMAMNAQFQPVKWMAKDCWVRSILDVQIDAGENAAVLDWKGLAIDTPLPTPTGWTTMGDVNVGDTIFGGDGKPCEVTAKSEVHHRACHWLRFDDNSPGVICDDEHLWVTNGEVKSTKQIAETLTIGKRPQKHHRIALHPGLELPDAELPIHPYLLGVWLGDGKNSSSEITNVDAAVWENITNCGYSVSHDYSARAEDGKPEVRTVYGIRTMLATLGVLRNKHIPPLYLRGSHKQRLHLLQGLMDTDGNANATRKQAVFTSCDKVLSDGVMELLHTLGQRPLQSEVNKSGFGVETVVWPISFRPQGISPFLLKRKQHVMDGGTEGNSWRRVVVSADMVPTVPTQCITVDSKDNTYLCSKEMIVTHNTGKAKPESSQLKLSAAFVFHTRPYVQKVSTSFVWLKENTTTKETFTRDQLPDIWQEFLPRVRRLEIAFQDDKWEAKPSGLCKSWCPVGKALCEHCGT